ncbi:hypothetical protein ACUXCC_002050 [Cytobacillus horneckiae]|nr:hypothetical protein [Cytobacillus horneckiae]MBN6887040.1 hypothetical protein [Cytobacillus horneckiae]
MNVKIIKGNEVEKRINNCYDILAAKARKEFKANNDLLNMINNNKKR